MPLEGTPHLPTPPSTGVSPISLVLDNSIQPLEALNPFDTNFLWFVANCALCSPSQPQEGEGFPTLCAFPGLPGDMKDYSPHPCSSGPTC